MVIIGHISIEEKITTKTILMSVDAYSDTSSRRIVRSWGENVNFIIFPLGVGYGKPTPETLLNIKVCWYWAWFELEILFDA